MSDSKHNSIDDLLVKNLRTILDTAMDGIISMDQSQKIILFNKAAESIFGWTAEQVIGGSIEVLIPARFAASHRGDVNRFGNGTIPSRRMGIQRTVMALRASGEEFPIEASISHTVVEKQTVFTVIVRDVTDATQYRKQIEQQSQILQQVSDAVSVVDASGRIIVWNEGAHRLFGWCAEEAIGKDAIELLGSDESKLKAEIDAQMEENQKWSGELTKKTRHGKQVIVEHRRTSLTDETGQVIGSIQIDIDITSRKKFERLSNRRQRLESIGTLAGGIAHDLNNVLTPILMGAKLLSSVRAPGNRQGLLDTITASAERGASLIEQLLSFAGGVRGERRHVRIEQLIAETRRLLEHTLPKTISIETHMADDCPQVLGDATELSQILMNLCINARDAMPEGGKLTIEAASTTLDGNSSQLHPDAHGGRYLVLKVSDTGCGMSSEILDRIFDPFFTTKEVGKGTGLGLATVQGISKSHGGFTIVYSETGRGSSFSVYLPAAETTESTDLRMPRTPIEAGNDRLLLLVDDESTILQMTSVALEAAGYRVVTARDGVKAIAKYSKNPGDFSAVILDIMMPEMDGLHTIAELMKINSNVKIIACSGLRTTEREIEVLSRGAKAFLAKPYSDDQLLRTISNVVGKDD